MRNEKNASPGRGLSPGAGPGHSPSLPATLAAYGGKFLVRGGRVQTLEGEWQPQRIVVLEFESAAKAKAWWSSQQYAEPKRIRQSASVTKMILVEGI